MRSHQSCEETNPITGRKVMNMFARQVPQASSALTTQRHCVGQAEYTIQ